MFDFLFRSYEYVFSFIYETFVAYFGSFKENPTWAFGLTLFSLFLFIIAGFWAGYLSWLASVFYLGLSSVDVKDASKRDKRV